MARLVCVILAGCWLTVAGCGTRSVSGGTPGLLTIGGEKLAEIQVRIHAGTGPAFQPVGFGVTRADGTFELLSNGASGALWLPAGEYRVTLETIGPPLPVSQDYLQADRTPLKISWSKALKSLELAVPASAPRT